MKEKLQILITLDKEEKKEIVDTYKDNSINVASRVLGLIKKDIKKLKSGESNEV